MNIGIVGYGKMGKEVEKIALQRHHNISFISNSTDIYLAPFKIL